jgi:iron complex transport system substrate-binding protein
MRRRPVLAALLGVAIAGPAWAASVADDAGRSVVVADTVERVMVAGPPASVFVYVLKPEALLGWVRPFTPAEAALVPEPWRSLPVLGRLTGRGGSANLEAIIGARPDVILDVGTIGPTYVDLADRTQAQTKIPYLLLDGRFAATAATLDKLGGLLGVPDRAAALGRYAAEVLGEIDGLLQQVPPERRPRVYLARGADGLETGLAGSINTEIIERAGGVNVAQGPERGDVARVSLEQVLRWNPEVIVTWDRQAFAHVEESPAWRDVTAVKSGRVHLSPSEPFGWIDRPPALNRLLGLRWLARILYPEAAAKGDLRALTQEFYKLFYHVDLDAAQLDALLAGAGG